ncbi:gonadotropin-releasing hormone receptor [Nephila pilipes]|uniref:Gonadotropin-releasing hormone receptor n=1 Tax=Nephila pilipes TaxID=299642 RepID=A0A8X6NXP3_NEPPI|nr:gonadotropin-releasing hormone receptor [Nephila pilipes]
MLFQNWRLISLNFFVVLHLIFVFEVHVFSGYKITGTSILYSNGKNNVETHDLIRNDRIKIAKQNVLEFGSFASKNIAKSSTREVMGRNTLSNSRNKSLIKTDLRGIHEGNQRKISKLFKTNREGQELTNIPLNSFNESKEMINKIVFHLNSSTHKKTIKSLIRPLRHLHLLSVRDFNTSMLNASENLVIKNEQLIFTKDGNIKGTQSLLLTQKTSGSDVVPFIESLNESSLNSEPTTMIREDLTLAINESILEWNATTECVNGSTCNQTYQHAPAFKSHTLVKGVVLLNLGVLACIGNVATLSSIIRRGRQHSSTVYLLLVHLSVSDLFVTSFCIVGEGLWTLTVEWYGGNLLCKVFKFLQMFSLYLSTFTLVVIGFDRLCAVKFPMRRIKARIQVHRAIIVAWLLSGVFSAPQVIQFSQVIWLVDGFYGIWSNVKAIISHK